MQQTNLSGSYFFYSCYLLCILRQIAITHNSHFGPRLQSTITRACAQASKQASKQTSKQANMLSIWFSTLLSFGPHLWFCLSQWCHVLRDCGTILQGASKHITTMPWRVIQYQHCERALIWTYRILHRTSECQAGLYIDHKGLTVCVLASWHAPSKTFPNHKHLQNTLLKWNECLSKDMPFWHKCATPDGYEPLTGLTMWPLDALESHSRSLVRLDAKFQVKIEKKKTTSSHSPLLP